MSGNPPSLAPQAAPHHGPADALHPAGDLEVLTHTSTGVHVLRQEYIDGYIYEYIIPIGVAIDPEDSHFAIPFFKGRILRTFVEGEFNYVSVWVPKTESHIYDFALEKVVALQEVDYTSTPDTEPEILHQNNQCTVSRLRFPTGWLYIVGVQLGLPWPSFYLIPSLAHTRGAPLVAVDRIGAGVDVKFWVADNSPYGPEN